MTISMPSLKRAPNGDHVARKGIPADIREAYAAAYGVKREALFRHPSGATAAQVQRAYGEWLSEVQGRITALRAAANGEATTMSTRELHELAARWYFWFTAMHHEEPGTVEQWEDMSDQMRDLWESGRTGLGAPEDDYEEEVIGPALRRRIRAKLIELAQLPSFLAVEALNLSKPSLDALVDGPLRSEFGSALRVLMRWASGDFAPDARAAGRAEGRRVAASTRKSGTGMTAWQAFEGWVAATGPSASTVNRWRAMFLDLDKRFDSKDVGQYTGDDARAWRDALLADGKSRVVVRDVWLTAARAIFNWLREEKRLISANPFHEARLKKAKVTRTREPFFTQDEIRIILSAALEPASPRLNAHLRDAYRWVP